MVKNMTLPISGPNISRDGIVGKHQRTNWPAIGDVEERRISTDMRGHIVMRKLDRIGASVVMHGQIYQPLICTSPSSFRHEAACQCPVTSLTGNEVYPITRRNKLPSQEALPPLRLSEARYNHAAVLVSVAWEQVGVEFPVKPLVHDEGPFLFHTFLIQCNTFASFIAAVSTPAVHRFDRRDICSA